VTDGHGSAEWLDKDSSLFPFANLTFDEMVSKHLSKAREIFETGKPEKWKQFPLYGRSSISYFKRQRIIIIDNLSIKKYTYLQINQILLN
jgi:hypothetical protein